jgi:glycosyltransferase involved in cell wall biosynthesis
VIVCAHNEESYIQDCLRSLIQQTYRPDFVVVVADRCTDRTVTIAKDELKNQRSSILEKKRATWANSISENLQMGLKEAKGDALVVVDADIIIPPNLLASLLPQLEQYAVVSPVVRTDSSQGTLNRLVSLWERTYAIAPLGDQPRGGTRAISINALNSVGGFRDVYAWESDLDKRLRGAGFRLKIDRSLRVIHRRKMTVRHSISYQIQAGRARKELHVSLFRTLLHSIIRLRPFVVVGYLKR